MSYEIVAIITLFGSLIGIGIILIRKIPILEELPEVSTEFNLKEFFSNIEERIKISSRLKTFSFEIFLQKILCRIKVLTLKTENKTSYWIQKLRERSQKKKEKANDNYWQEIKKSTKK